MTTTKSIKQSNSFTRPVLGLSWWAPHAASWGMARRLRSVKQQPITGQMRPHHDLESVFQPCWTDLKKCWFILNLHLQRLKNGWVSGTKYLPHQVEPRPHGAFNSIASAEAGSANSGVGSSTIWQDFQHQKLGLWSNLRQFLKLNKAFLSVYIQITSFYYNTSNTIIPS